MPAGKSLWKKIQNLLDGPGALGSGDNAKVMAWNNATGRFEMTSLPAAVTPGGSTAQVQYNNAGAFAGDAGLLFNPTTDVLTVVGGMVTGKVYPPSNSANAFGLFRANGTTQDWYYDSVNGSFAIGTTPVAATKLLIATPSNSAVPLAIKAFSASQAVSLVDILDHDGTQLSSISRAGWGIGITGISSYKIDANETTNVQIARFRQSNSSFPAIIQIDRPATARGGAIVYTTAGGYNWYAGMAYRSGGTSNNYFIGQAANFSPDSSTSVLTLSTAGYAGISLGTTNPGAYMDLAAAAAGTAASLRVRPGVEPTTKNDGDVWYATWLRFRRGSTTEQFATGVQGAGGAATAGATWTATEQAMLQKCYDIARAFGQLS